MKYTDEYKLKLPEGSDKVNVEDLNKNSINIDEELLTVNVNLTQLKYNKADITNPTFKKSIKLQKLSDPDDDNSDLLPAESVITESDLRNALEVKNLDLE